MNILKKILINLLKLIFVIIVITVIAKLSDKYEELPYWLFIVIIMIGVNYKK